MNFRSIFGVVAVVIAPVCFAGDQQPDVAVCLHNTYVAPPGVIERAKQMARAILSSGGVRIVWAESPAVQHESGAVLCLDVAFITGNAWASNKDSEALAQAHPFAMPLQPITIRYDRLLDTIGPEKELEPVLLAHVLAHEIGHMLEFVDHHSDSGVMKKRWDRQDYREMQWKPLPFAPEDVQLMQQGLREWQTRARKLMASGD